MLLSGEAGIGKSRLIQVLKDFLTVSQEGFPTTVGLSFAENANDRGRGGHGASVGV